MVFAVLENFVQHVPRIAVYVLTVVVTEYAVHPKVVRHVLKTAEGARSDVVMEFALKMKVVEHVLRIVVIARVVEMEFVVVVKTV